MLLRTLQELKKATGFASLSSISKLSQDIRIAEQELIDEHLGQAFYDELNSAIDNGLEADSEEAKAIDFAHRFIAHKALYTVSSKINVRIENTGISSTSHDQSVPVREWMLNDMKDQVLKDACKHLDLLLLFLETNKGNYPTWTSSSQYGRNREFFINSLSKLLEKSWLLFSFCLRFIFK